MKESVDVPADVGSVDKNNIRMGGKLFALVEFLLEVRFLAKHILCHIIQ